MGKFGRMRTWAGSRQSGAERLLKNIMATWKPLAFTLVSLSLAATPAIASAASVSSPIVIDGTQATGDLNKATQPLLTVDFTNADTRVATDVTFVAVDNGEVVNSFEDHGQFAPGVEIDHTFGDLSSSGDQIKVASVTFADGSSWTAPDLSF